MNSESSLGSGGRGAALGRLSPPAVLRRHGLPGRRQEHLGKEINKLFIKVNKQIEGGQTLSCMEAAALLALMAVERLEEFRAATTDTEKVDTCVNCSEP